ncbi:MAG TPA: bifunctional 3'-5' exonuclease/DNA polymerase, partial [Streptosporangiaceae bacterium]|nr:bifunctional 3'-5' exonuclease/DNA polymerase [Streptosporangiaceae bacterium]
MLRHLGEDGSTEGETVRNEDLAAAVAAHEHAGDVRWVWADTAAIYPRLLRAGVRVERCHDLALTETLLLAREGRGGEPVTLAAAWARARGEPVPSGAP